MLGCVKHDNLIGYTANTMPPHFVFFQRITWNPTDDDVALCLLKGKTEVRKPFLLFYKLSNHSNDPIRPIVRTTSAFWPTRRTSACWYAARMPTIRGVATIPTRRGTFPWTRNSPGRDTVPTIPGTTPPRCIQASIQNGRNDEMHLTHFDAFQVPVYQSYEWQ